MAYQNERSSLSSSETQAHRAFTVDATAYCLSYSDAAYCQNINVNLQYSNYNIGTESFKFKFKNNSKEIKKSHISPSRVLMTYDAVCFANFCGYIFNCEATINFGYLNIVNSDEIFYEFRKFLSCFRNFCLHRKFEPIYWYVFERPKNKSLHVHMQIHIPIQYHGRFRQWFRKYIQSIARPNAFLAHTQPHVIMKASATTNSQWCWFRYMIKGMSRGYFIPGDNLRKLSEQMGVNPIPQGMIEGKRIGVSRAISFKAWSRVVNGESFEIAHLDGNSSAKNFWTDAFYEQYRQNLTKSQNSTHETGYKSAIPDLF